MEKEDFHAKIFMGTNYSLGKVETIKDLRNELEAIINDLPEDDSLEISEFYIIKDKIGYTLRDGIPQ